VISTPAAEGRTLGGRVLGLRVVQPLSFLRSAARSPESDISGLVADARRGDEPAFTELYRRYADRVYRFCLFRVNRPADAEDLMQQTFVRAIEALPRYEERGLPFGAWLFRIARNAVIDFQRSCRDHVDLDALTLAGADPSIGDDTDGLVERDALLGALAKLTPDQREVLGYRFFADLSARETGRLMDRDEATIRGLQARALEALRRQFRAIEGASGEMPVLGRSAREPDGRACAGPTEATGVPA
jgi:RNA polymerase sigma-70 factor (ECF subfamily)